MFRFVILTESSPRDRPIPGCNGMTARSFASHLKTCLFATDLTKYTIKCILLFLIKDGKAIGGALCHIRNESLHVNFICSVRKGVGTLLMQKIEDVARMYEKPIITLTSTSDAIAFYEKLGFIKGYGENKPITRSAHKIVKQSLYKFISRKRLKAYRIPSRLYVHF